MLLPTLPGPVDLFFLPFVFILLLSILLACTILFLSRKETPYTQDLV